MIVDIAQIVVAIGLIVVVLLQRQSAGLSGAFGGSGGEFYHERRGAEKMLFRATIALSILFFVLAVANVAGL